MRYQMIHKSLLLALFSLIFTTSALPDSIQIVAPTEAPTPVPARKKIVILTCHGGYGHMAACATLKNILVDYDIHLFSPFDNGLKIVKTITFGALNSEDIYNKLLQNGWVGTLNFMARYSTPLIIDLNRKRIKRKIMQVLEKEKPDLLISVIPLLNYPASTVAMKAKIPYLFITLDANLKLWLRDFDRCKDHNFLLTVGMRTPLINKQLKKKKIPPHKIKEVGIALRQDFFEKKDKEKIREEWKIPANKPVLMVMMGGTGTSQLLRYIKQLTQLDIPVHLLACVGRNDSLIAQLNKIKRPDNVTLGVIPFTTRISDLMSVSDIFITRPSPNACNEAMYSGVPIIIDQTVTTLFWERATIDIVKQYGKGGVVKKMKQLNPMVKTFLSQPKPDVKKSGLLDLPRFETSIKTIVQDMIRTNEEHAPALK